MKLKEFLEMNSHYELNTNQLHDLKHFFKDIDEFKGKTVNIIDEPTNIIMTKNYNILKENISIHKLLLCSDEVQIICSKNSININIENIIKELNTYNYTKYDMSDIGNDIGIILGKYFSTDGNSEEDYICGFDEHDFISGFKHGISLANCTHD
jgi:hypothetical protein